ncbi:hypothetical protein SRRS_45330 [Sporomusa rhizae]|uniref:aspartyl-phosphate phosphatase Spo0E family protein n=1 Tax=Sporomusa rhizae TaxID=357999 RepID=UPI00352A5D08
MKEFDEILRQIEYLRHMLNRLATEKGVSDLEVVRLSKQLDEVLNRYHKMFKAR